MNSHSFRLFAWVASFPITGPPFGMGDSDDVNSRCRALEDDLKGIPNQGACLAFAANLAESARSLSDFLNCQFNCRRKSGGRRWAMFGVPLGRLFKFGGGFRVKLKFHYSVP